MNYIPEFEKEAARKELGKPLAKVFVILPRIGMTAEERQMVTSSPDFKE